MNVVIIGASENLGREIAIKFLSNGHKVIGIDNVTSAVQEDNYIQYICDTRYADDLPHINDVHIFVSVPKAHDSDNIDLNLIGVINCIHKYVLNNANIKSVVNLADAAATTGADFADYVASMGGLISYTRHVAKDIAKYGATCNTLSFGGVLCSKNWSVMHDMSKWENIMTQTPLNKWATPTEVADWVYFMSVINKSCTAQDIVVDNGEMFNHNFVW